jgi:hypothetical protein
LLSLKSTLFKPRQLEIVRGRDPRRLDAHICMTYREQLEKKGGRVAFKFGNELIRSVRSLSPANSCGGMGPVSGRDERMSEVI